MKVNGLKWLIPFLIVGLWGCNPDEEIDEMGEEFESDFCYDLLVASSTYQELTEYSEVELLTDLNNANVYTIDLGFDFTLCSEVFDKIYVSEEFAMSFTYTASANFTNLLGYELMPLGSYLLDSKWNSDAGESLSKLRYNTIGSPGSRITTIEFKDIGLLPAEFTEGHNYNYQITLYEWDNSIVYHYGELTGSPTSVGDVFKVGLYGVLGEDGLFLFGNEGAPSLSNSFAVGDAELNSYPNANRAYKFQP